MIVQAALPLVAEYGAAVTTSKIARAAGIGEGTIFRVFANKEELLDACMAEAVQPDHVVRELRAVSLELALTERLTEAAEALQAHLARMGAVAGALHASGYRRRGVEGEERVRGAGRDDALAGIRAAVGELLAPERETLRLPVEQTAGLFLGLLFAQPRVDGEPQVDVRGLVAVFLHGALGDRGEKGAS